MFDSRFDAGEKLAAALASRGLAAPIVVYALPRGGAPVAAAVARRLAAPLDLLFVRKIGAPWQPELALGAVVGGDPPLVERNEEILKSARISESDFQALVRKELDEIANQRRRYRLGEGLSPRGKTAIVVDDGVATGATARAGLRALRLQSPRRLVFAVPVGPPDSLAGIAKIADAVVCLSTPLDFAAVGEFYRSFGQVSDREVETALASAPGAAGLDSNRGRPLSI